jgi:NADH dehydrogenase/NADH:ubiquinone oxidoreductase subunit G
MQHSLTRRNDWHSIRVCLEAIKQNFLLCTGKKLKINVINHSPLLNELGYDPITLKQGFGNFCYFVNFDNDFGYLKDFFTNEKGENFFIKKITSSSKFSVYQGHHGSDIVLICDLVLPTITSIEQNSFFLDYLGHFFNSPKLQQNENWVKTNSDVLNTITSLLNHEILTRAVKSNFSSSLNEVKNAIYAKSDVSTKFHVDLNSLLLLKKQAIKFGEVFGCSFTKDIEKNFIVQGSLKPVVVDFYRTDNISRNSQNMAKCSLEFKVKSNFRKNL